MPRFDLVADADYDPADDWIADSDSKAIMHFPAFFDALFELADMWCTSVCAEDYAELLKVGQELCWGRLTLVPVSCGCLSQRGPVGGSAPPRAVLSSSRCCRTAMVVSCRLGLSVGVCVPG